jgi:hypothetical protein
MKECCRVLFNKVIIYCISNILISQKLKVIYFSLGLFNLPFLILDQLCYMLAILEALFALNYNYFDFISYHARQESGLNP